VKRRGVLFVVSVWLLAFAPGRARADVAPTVFALVVAGTGSPRNDADDEAVQYAELFRALGSHDANVVVHADLDEETDRGHPWVRRHSISCSPEAAAPIRRVPLYRSAMASSPRRMSSRCFAGSEPLPKRATARDAMLAVAALGGHLKSNGDPGWLVLGRGLNDLLALGWRAREAARSDRS
jgi:hypothetical protein